jgi:hypothetical protein
VGKEEGKKKKDERSTVQKGNTTKKKKDKGIGRRQGEKIYIDSLQTYLLNGQT